MRRLLVIGIGTGNPDHITVEAINKLATVDVVFLVDKGSEKADLLALRRDICRRYIKKPHRFVEAPEVERNRSPKDYSAAVEDWHERRAALYERMIQEGMSDSECGTFLVWGDPSLYDSTLRLLHRVAERRAVEFDLDVVPGITSVQTLAARHQIALNTVGQPVHITTGRQLANGMTNDSVVVMLDGDCAFKHLQDKDVEIFWGAYLGTPDEVLISGKLRDCEAKIEAARAAARARHGWIMDTYLLRRTVPKP